MNDEPYKFPWIRRLRPILAALGAIPILGSLAQGILAICDQLDKDVTAEKLDKLDKGLQ